MKWNCEYVMEEKMAMGCGRDGILNDSNNEQRKELQTPCAAIR